MLFTAHKMIAFSWLLLGTAATAFLVPTPVDLVFEDEARQMYSTAHCFGGNLQHDNWRTTACFMENLCFNTTSKEFLFFAQSKNHSPSATSLGTFNFKWSSRYDKKVKFEPKLVLGEIPPNAKFTPKQELWIPFLPLAPANIGHLIWDDYLPWYMLARASEVLHYYRNGVQLRPLWVNIETNPPWATCDWVRQHEGPGHSLPAGYSDRCLKNNKKWLPLVLGPNQTSLLETSKWKEDRLVCFRSSAHGMTSFSNQGPGHHGWNPGDGIPPSFGRAPLLWDFRSHMMQQAGLRDVPTRTEREIIVLFSSKSSDRIKIDFSPVVHYMEEEIEALNDMISMRVGTPNSRLRVTLRHQVMYELSAVEQIALSNRVCVYLTAAGGGAFTAQFLPKGSALLLFQDDRAEHLHKGNVDWKFFNAATWLRPRFLDYTMASNASLVAGMVRQEIQKCLSFMKALEV